jgi:hypothetical protein
MDSSPELFIRKTLEWASFEGHLEVISALGKHKPALLNRLPDQYGHKRKVQASSSNVIDV